MTHSSTDDAGVPYHSTNTYLSAGHSRNFAIPFLCFLHGSSTKKMIYDLHDEKRRSVR